MIFQKAFSISNKTVCRNICDILVELHNSLVWQIVVTYFCNISNFSNAI